MRNSLIDEGCGKANEGGVHLQVDVGAGHLQEKIAVAYRDRRSAYEFGHRLDTLAADMPECFKCDGFPSLGVPVFDFRLTEFFEKFVHPIRLGAPAVCSIAAAKIAHHPSPGLGDQFLLGRNGRYRTDAP